ncbi:EF-hand domain-containing protein [Terriglobus saanensis]|uniref:EF-Hand, Calmodulin n=1 Tax=Terriglobus saanensis (strain ATCC BAA-1853 / DSM 23119 / SP1PR4) TaxID=401053 RepID=E8V028_TERSS|nr:EF-hand domain-containing protein [Terriglobus saanensis]ADV82183.1 EF-Hand, Calmodulin [Terriglobus saanensis SP1PR4]
MQNMRSLVLLPVLLGSAALAQQQTQPPRPVLLALDTNHDGSLSESEILAAPTALLTLDANHDGIFSAEEYSPKEPVGGATPDEQVQRLMAFDKNGDGELTRDELPERMQRLMDRADTDHNGRLTATEIRAMASSQTAPTGRPMAPGQNPALRGDLLVNAIDLDHDGTLSAEEIKQASVSLKTLDVNNDGTISPNEMRPKVDPKARALHLLEEWDTNKDGKISKAEAPDRMQAQFEKYDTNGDGFLTMDEILVFFANADNSQPRAPRPNAQEKQ